MDDTLLSDIVQKACCLYQRTKTLSAIRSSSSRKKGLDLRRLLNRLVQLNCSVASTIAEHQAKIGLHATPSPRGEIPFSVRSVLSWPDVNLGRSRIGESSSHSHPEVEGTVTSAAGPSPRSSAGSTRSDFDISPTRHPLGGLPTGARNTIWTPPCPLPVPDRRDTDWSYDHPSGLYLYSPIPDNIQGAGTSISNVPNSLEGTDVLISRELDFLLSPEDPITLFQTDAEIESPPSSRASPMAPRSPSIWTPESPFTS